MTSKEALERIKLHKYIKCKECDETMLEGCRCCNNELKNSEEFETIEKDLKNKETTIKTLVEILQNTSKENETLKSGLLDFINDLKILNIIKKSLYQNTNNGQYMFQIPAENQEQFERWLKNEK
jgi:hypothetical protein